ncbi:CD99 antigen-like protein 2 isoform X2 [Pyxicephalus adspersus]|uniref:CD99 antigen-like protein 2 isoform X2 n=1 Tax=Pyxicephalus adspersus TaxID=30357 RepID=UPI003B5930C9
MALLRSSLVCAVLLVAAVWSAHGQDDDFNLEDALDFVPTEKPKPAPKPPKPPKKLSDELDLSDFFDPTQPPKVIPKPPPRRPDIPTTKKPHPSTNKPPKKPDPNDFDLSDALDGKNDRPAGGGGFSDSDLDDIFNDGYKPDKGKGGRGGGRGSSDAGNRDNTDTGALAETGTIAGIASALAMALIGAVSSYISYQQKKFCFSIQQGLNAEYVKGEHMEGVVSEEPQVKYSSLQSQSAVPPSEDPSKV